MSKPSRQTRSGYKSEFNIQCTDNVIKVKHLLAMYNFFFGGGDVHIVRLKRIYLFNDSPWRVNHKQENENTPQYVQS